ncbi:RAD52 motif-containing protein 1-like isoform X3 [Panthera onca]
MAELVSFTVPTESDKTLLVWELSSGPTAEALHHSLFAVFSQFGLLYSVRVFPNAAVARPGFYAIIKFYSARDAHRAQKACDQKQLFQNSPVKLQDLSDLEERANEDTVPPLQKQSLKFFCALEVVLPSYECRSPGAGMAKETLDDLEEGPLSFLMKRRTTQKLAIQKAVSDAFQKLLIVILGPGASTPLAWVAAPRSLRVSCPGCACWPHCFSLCGNRCGCWSRQLSLRSGPWTLPS